jgi:peptidoglycan/LPS O-acetylase OafA/YrhL
MPARRPRGRIARLGPSFFFVLALVYLALLLLLAVGREAGFWFLDELHDPIAGVLPLGVPWFGALGPSR